MNFVYGHDEEIAKFVAQFDPRGRRAFVNCKAIGVVDDDKLIAGIVYFNFDEEAGVIEFGLAAIDRRWFNRTTFRRMFEYPFIECGCQMLYTRVRADNEYLLSQMARLNFSLTLIPRMYGRDADGVIGTLTDDQWLDSNLAQRVYRKVAKQEEAA